MPDKINAYLPDMQKRLSGNQYPLEALAESRRLVKGGSVNSANSFRELWAERRQRRVGCTGKRTVIYRQGVNLHLMRPFL